MFDSEGTGADVRARKTPPRHVQFLQSRPHNNPCDIRAISWFNDQSHVWQYLIRGDRTLTARNKLLSGNNQNVADEIDTGRPITFIAQIHGHLFSYAIVNNRGRKLWANLLPIGVSQIKILAGRHGHTFLHFTLSYHFRDLLIPRI